MPNPVNAFIHGVKSKIQVNGQLFDVEQMDPNFECDTDDITHTGANGYQVLLAGILRGDASIGFVYDTNNQPTVSPLSMVPGLSGVLILLPDGVIPFPMPGLFTGFKWTGGPKAGAVRCTTMFKLSGQYTLPGN